MNYDQVDVHVDIKGAPSLAGRAYFNHRRGATSTSFTYEQAFLRNPDSYDLAPDMPRAIATHHTDGLPRVFADSAPDRWGRGLIDRRLRQEGLTRKPGPVDYLLNVADQARQGALRFRAVDQDGGWLHADSDIPRTIDLPKLLNASDAIARGDDNYDAIKAILNADTAALGGARPKATVQDGTRLLIAKFGHPDDTTDVIGWEATALDLAARAGIPTPARRTTRVGDRTVLVLERFDRTGNGARIGYLSALTLLGYDDGDHGDYLDMAEALAEVAGAGATVDLHDLWKRIAFSIAINNTDDHLRNHGLLRVGREWRLSPIFDINPNPDLNAQRSTSIGGQVTRDAALEALLASRAIFGLSTDRARTALTDVLEATADWKRVAETNGIPVREMNEFSDALDCGRSALQATAGR